MPSTDSPPGPFAHTWAAEILPAAPLIRPNRHYTYPFAVEEIERSSLEVMVYPAHEPAFSATCALGFADPLAPTALWAHPDPSTLCVVAGGYAYLIDTDRPERFEQVAYRPVLSVLATPRLLIFVGNRSMAAYATQGLAWETPRLSDEGLTVVRVGETTMDVVAWDLETDRETAFALDLATGRPVP